MYKNPHYEEAKAIFMMITRMVDVKDNYKNKYKNLGCEICKVEENTEHLFKCKKWHDLNEKIKGGTLQEVLRNNQEEYIARIIKEIIRRIKKQKETENTKSKTNTVPLDRGLSLPDGRVWQIYSTAKYNLLL